MADSLRFLVIDDDAVDRKAVQRALAQARLLGELVEADGAEPGLAAIAERDFDCVLLDFHMPGKNGMDVLRAIRGGGRNRATPVILLTGHGDEQTAVVLMKAGATDYLAKSALTAERLEQSVRYAQRMYRAEEETQAARRSLARYTAQLQGLAEASTEVSARIDTPTVLRSFAERARQLLSGSDAGVAIFHPEKQDLVLHASRGAGRPERTSPRAPFQALVAALPGPTYRARADVLRDPALLALLEAAAIDPPAQGWLGVPVTAPDGVLGLIQVIDPRLNGTAGGELAITDRMVAAQLAQMLGVVLDNARLIRSARDATRLRDDVMGVVSHDLRNPLHVISIAAGMLRFDASERQRSQLRKIERAVERSNRLIEDLLDVTRIESGPLRLDLATHRLSTLLDEAGDQLRPLAEEKQIALVVSAPRDLPPVRADRARFEQVLTNLVGNALKFTPPGGQITVHAATGSSGLVVSVRDTGSGILPEHLPHVFDRFWQADANRRRGAGLGLTIVQAIIDAHGGKVWVESQPGEGTTVSFTLPAAQ